jgi:hypothetical protein
MGELQTVRIPVWRALLDGDCKQIHKTEEQLWHELKTRNGWYKPENQHRWTAVVSVEDVPVAMGVPRDWSAEGGCGGVHVHYTCPYCESEEFSDDVPNDQSPYLWFCECGKGIVLVKTE